MTTTYGVLPREVVYRRPSQLEATRHPPAAANISETRRPSDLERRCRHELAPDTELPNALSRTDTETDYSSPSPFMRNLTTRGQCTHGGATSRYTDPPHTSPANQDAGFSSTSL
jgi:hypothetical protein